MKKGRKWECPKKTPDRELWMLLYRSWTWTPAPSPLCSSSTPSCQPKSVAWDSSLSSPLCDTLSRLGLGLGLAYLLLFSSCKTNWTSSLTRAFTTWFKVRSSSVYALSSTSFHCCLMRSNSACVSGDGLMIVCSVLLPVDCSHRHTQQSSTASAIAQSLHYVQK